MHRWSVWRRVWHLPLLLSTLLRPRPFPSPIHAHPPPCPPPTPADFNLEERLDADKKKAEEEEDDDGDSIDRQGIEVRRCRSASGLRGRRGSAGHCCSCLCVQPRLLLPMPLPLPLVQDVHLSFQPPLPARTVRTLTLRIGRARGAGTRRRRRRTTSKRRPRQSAAGGAARQEQWRQRALQRLSILQTGAAAAAQSVPAEQRQRHT